MLNAQSNGYGDAKYPRTPHFPWSPGLSPGDIIMPTNNLLLQHNVIVTTKMDGENTTISASRIHARSVDSGRHDSRSWIKDQYSYVQEELRSHFPYLKLVGENVYARHSIDYTDLPSYFLLFAAYDMEQQYWLSWADVITWAAYFDIPTVPVLHIGHVTESHLQDQFRFITKQGHEGIVVRTMIGWHNDSFSYHIQKAVRANHVQSDEHWLNQPVIKNKLRR